MWLKQKLCIVRTQKKTATNEWTTDRPATEEMKCNKWTNEYHTLDNELLFRFLSIAANVRQTNGYIGVIVWYFVFCLDAHISFFFAVVFSAMHYSCSPPLRGGDFSHRSNFIHIFPVDCRSRYDELLSLTKCKLLLTHQRHRCRRRRCRLSNHNKNRNSQQNYLSPHGTD